MEKEYRERPSEELIANFKQELERLLSAHDARIEVRIYENPIVIHSSMNGIDTGTTYHWIDQVLISTPDTEDLEVNIFAQGIDDETINDAFTDACLIQDQLYGHLKRDQGDTKSGDKYWDLWDKKPRTSV